MMLPRIELGFLSVLFVLAGIGVVALILCAALGGWWLWENFDLVRVR